MLFNSVGAIVMGAGLAICASCDILGGLSKVVIKFRETSEELILLSAIDLNVVDIGINVPSGM